MFACSHFVLAPLRPLTPRGGSRSVTLRSSSLSTAAPHSPGRLSLRYTTLVLATLRCAAAPHSPGGLSLRSTTLLLATLRCAAAPHRCRCAGGAPNVQAHVGTAVQAPGKSRSLRSLGAAKPPLRTHMCLISADDDEK